MDCQNWWPSMEVQKEGVVSKILLEGSKSLCGRVWARACVHAHTCLDIHFGPSKNIGA